jgi:transglutaminase-like putative cysteine protease
MRKTIALSLVAGWLIAWNWLRLESGTSFGQAVLIVLLAIAPALFRSLPARAGAAAVAFLVAAGSAFRLGPGLHYPGRLVGRFGDGFLDFYDFKLPFKTAHLPNMHGTVLLAVFAFTLAAALAIAARRPLPAALALLVGAGWPATLLTGGEYARGGALLAGLLVLVTGLSDRPRAGALAAVAGVAVVLAGVAASTSPALARGEFLTWQSWDLYTHQQRPVDVSYVWSSNYSGLTFPRKTTVVLRIKAPDRPQYWRATELSTIVDGRWLEDTAPQQQSTGYLGEPGLVGPQAANQSNWIEQRVTVEGLRDTHLVAADVPVRFDDSKLGLTAYDPAGVAYVGKGLERGDVYRAWSYEPQPTPAELAHSRPIYPQLIRVQRKYLEVSQRVWVPPFGTPGRRAAIERLFTTSARAYELAPYRPLYLEALRQAGDARSPYAAAVALESWFRSSGDFLYDPHPPPPPAGVPALVDFVKRTQSGYCQHFAGAMTLMLRYLGVPARVAAGFSSGHYDNGEWVVTDHDAHMWVEVWFRGWGWVPFDPTPGRGGLSGGYSASSKAFDAAAAAIVLAGKEGLKSFARRAVQLGFKAPPVHVSPDVPDLAAPKPVPAAAHHSRAPGLLRLLLLVLAGLVVTIAAVKLVLRRSRYATRDPRRLAAAARRELRDILRDQLVQVPDSATLEELAALVEAEFGFDARAFGLHASAARFGPASGAREAAREMRRAMRDVRRGIREELTRLERTRGLLSLRSLGLA